MPMNKTLSFLVISVGFLVLLACSKKAEEEAEEPEKTYEAVGVVYSVEPEENSIIISHEQIPGLMGAMTMRFAVKDKSEFEGIAAEDSVKFTLSVGEGEYVASGIQKIE